MPQQQAQRKPGGRPATPPPGANLSRQIERLTERVEQFENMHASVMNALGDLRRELIGREAHEPVFQPAIPHMTEAEIEDFQEEVETAAQQVQHEDLRREQTEMDRLARERQAWITVDEPDAFVYAGERWIFNEQDATFKVPETIARLFLKRKKERAEVRRIQNNIVQNLTSRSIDLNTMEQSVEAMLGNKVSRQGGRNRGLIQRSRS